MVRRGLGLLLLVLLFWGVAQACGQAEGLVIIGTQEPPVKETAYTRDEVLQFMRNTDAPAFSLQSVDGATVDLADYRGNVVLVSFCVWKTWPCSTARRRNIPM
ncbi:MAG TPA: redoxin domain-containing protein [Clostridia bacterium]|nr:redoxin domain-containing protein [Clostridia bacterium]